MQATAHGGCTDSVTGSALKLTLGENPLPHPGIEPASAACRSDVLLTEPHRHTSMKKHTR